MMIYYNNKFLTSLYVFSTVVIAFVVLSLNTNIAYSQGCPIPAASGVQPQITDLAADITSACTNSLVTDKPTPEVPGISAVSPKLPRIFRGYPTNLAKPVDGYIPCVILMAIGQQESTGWKQFVADYGQTGNTVISGDCGYGITQITGAPIMTGQDSNVDRNRVAGEATYNIGTGARVLIEKWNGLNYYSGNNDPYVAEDWYYAVWAYNGFVYGNNPNNSSFPSNRLPFDGTQPIEDYPYQELIWGWAANPPTALQNVWEATALTLPPRSDLAAPINGNPTKTHINTPQPAHGSCTKLFAPMIIVPNQSVQSSSL